MTKIEDVVLKGAACEVYASKQGFVIRPKKGTWEAKGATYEIATQAALRLVKASTLDVEVPFTQVIFARRYHGDDPNEVKITHGVAVGIHGGSSHALVRMGDEKKAEQLSGWGETYQRFNEKEEQEFLALHRKTLEADAAFEKFKQARSISLVEEVEQAIEAKLGKAVK